MAGYSAAVKLNNMVITSLTTLGNGISNYTAQNLGAAKYDRIRAGFRAGLKLVWALCVPLVLLYVFAGRPLVHIFLDSPEGLAMDTGVMFLRIIAPFYFIVSAKLVSDGILRGAGLMKKFMIATFTDLVLRVALRSCSPARRLHDRHLDFLAHRLDDCDGSVHRVLRLRSLGAHPRRIVLSYDHPCVCMGGRFFAAVHERTKILQMRGL